MKKIICVLLAIITLCSIVTIPAFAASTTGFDILTSTKYAKTYTLSSSGRTTPYTSKYLSTRGTTTYGASSTAYIANSSDELYVMDVGSTNGKYWAYVSYPTSSRRVNAYISLSAITKNNGNHIKTTSTGKFYCSLREGSSNNSNYYVAKGDTVYLVAKSSSKYQILYPISGGKWRLAWCNASDYNKYCGVTNSSSSSSSMKDVTSYFAGKTITLKSVQNGKYLCADANYSNTPAMCNRSSTTNWTTFTVSTMTADGWVGLKSSTNNKYLSATNNITDTPVRSVANSLQSWECFKIYQKDSNYYIKAQVNNKWLCVRVDKSGAPVQAYASAASTWERFSISVKGQSQTSSTSYWDSKVGSTIASIKNSSGYTSYYGSKNLSAQGGYYGQCTWYAYGRFLEVNNIALKTAPHAKYWLSNNTNDSRVKVVYGASNIMPKSIAVRTSGTYGHVIFIEHVTYNSNGTPAYVYFTECNTDNNGTYNAGKDCILQKLSYNSFVSNKNPAGYIIAK